jgi:hypothetical protein
MLSVVSHNSLLWPHKRLLRKIEFNTKFEITFAARRYLVVFRSNAIPVTGYGGP